MENRSSSLYLYVALTVVIVLAMFSIFRSSTDPDSDWLPVDLPGSESASSTETSSRANTSFRQTSLARKDQQISRLNQLLNEKNSELSSIRRNLNTTTRETVALKKKLTENQNLVDELLGLSAGSLTSRSKNTKKMPANSTTRSKSAEKSGDTEAPPPMTVEELQAQLENAEEELEFVQNAAEQELRAADQEHQELQSAAADVIVSAGEAVVPRLVNALSNREARIRAWSAYLLGRIGPDAVDAVSALEQALSDSDETVQEEAQRALDAIR